MVKRTNDRGFSLLELLIIVAIILIIVTMGLPNFLRSRQYANENAAVANLRNVNTGLLAYSSSSGRFTDIPGLMAARLIDDRFIGSVSGYNYVVTLSNNNMNFTATATAASPNNGRYDFYSTPDYVVRYATTPSRAPASQNGNPVK